MSQPGSAPKEELKGIFRSIELIEADLAKFQNQILPTLNRAGVNLADFTFRLGAGYQQSAEQLYQQVEARAQASGVYEPVDLDALTDAAKQRQLARRLQNWGSAISVVTQVGSQLLDAYKRQDARKKVIQMVNIEKSRASMMLDNIDQVEQNLREMEEVERSYFMEVAARKAASAAERKQMRKALTNAVDGYRDMAEGQARLAFAREVYHAIQAFNENQFETSLNQLLKVGIEDRPVFLLEGMRYLQMLDRLIARLDWETPYYIHGLPEGISFFVGPGKQLLPEGARLESIEAAEKRIQRETPPLRSLKAFIRAMRVALQEIGSFAVPLRIQPAVMRVVWMVVAVLAIAGLLFAAVSSGLAGQPPAISAGQAAALIFFLLLIGMGVAAGLFFLKPKKK